MASGLADHLLIGVAFVSVLVVYAVLVMTGHDAPRLLDAVIALAGIIGGFAARQAVSSS